MYGKDWSVSKLANTHTHTSPQEKITPQTLRYSSSGTPQPPRHPHSRLHSTPWFTPALHNTNIHSSTSSLNPEVTATPTATPTATITATTAHLHPPKHPIKVLTWGSAVLISAPACSRRVTACALPSSAAWCRAVQWAASLTSKCKLLGRERDISETNTLTLRCLQYYTLSIYFTWNNKNDK